MLKIKKNLMSVLGPILFNLYINDMCQEILIGFVCGRYKYSISILEYRSGPSRTE